MRYCNPRKPDFLIKESKVKSKNKTCHIGTDRAAVKISGTVSHQGSHQTLVCLVIWLSSSSWTFHFFTNCNCLGDYQTCWYFSLCFLYSQQVELIHGKKESPWPPRPAAHVSRHDPHRHHTHRHHTHFIFTVSEKKFTSILITALNITLPRLLINTVHYFYEPTARP